MAAFITKVQANVGTSRARVGNYTVGSGKVAIVIGMTVANIASQSVNATVEYTPDGSTFVSIAKNVMLNAGEVLAPLDALGKVSVPAGGAIHVSSSLAASLDVVMSAVERDV